MSRRGARLCVLAAALLFSTGGAAIKWTDLSAWQVAGGRSLIAAVLLALLFPSWRRGWNRATVAVGSAYGATLLLYVVANKLTTAANAIFLQTTAPLYLMLLAPRLLGERTRRSDLVLAGVLVVGLGLFFVSREPALATAPDPPLGNLLGALSGLTWAFAILGLRWLSDPEVESRGDPVGGAVVLGNLLVFVVCLPLMTLEWTRDGFAISAADWGVVVYLGAFQIGLAYVFMVRGIRGVRALEASLLLLLEPVANAVWAWLVHGEQPGPLSMLGCTLIGIGVVAHTLRGTGE